MIMASKHGLKQKRWDPILGWLALGISTLVTSFWAFWGIVENFHEGWYQRSLLANLGLMLVQYLSPMLIFMALLVISLLWPRIGAALHIIMALAAAWFFDAFSNTVVLFLLLPFIGLACLFWFGRPPPRKLALRIALGVPLLVLLVAGIGPAVRVAQRVDDGNLQARLVQGNGIELIWAPAGPGWPTAGGNWAEAEQSCRHLNDEGISLSHELQDLWRLPSVDEAVRSMARHGENSGGVWDPESAEAAYQETPDKESPLWQVHSQVIYWWTATEVDDERAYMIAYDGRVWTRHKTSSQDYLGFRCVRVR